MAKKLESIIINPSLIRDQWLSPELAVRTVLSFERRFGRKHLELACHAALPSILTPELINLIRINFLNDREIDWIAEMDFLLSPLCRPIEDEVYEVEPCVREVLLLEMETLYGEKRAEEIKQEIAKFLWIYLHQKSQENQRPEFRKTQEWIATAYLDPDGLIQKMRESLQSSFVEENSLLQLSKQIPVVKNLELLAEPLVKVQQKGDYQQLMRDTRVVAHVLYGEEPITEIEKGTSLLSSPFFGWLKQTSKIIVPPPQPPPQPPIPARLRMHFARVIEAITRGDIVAVLGSEINLCDRPLQDNGEPEKWHPDCNFPPTDNEIAAYLIESAGLEAEFLEMTFQTKIEQLPETLKTGEAHNIFRLNLPRVAQDGELKQRFLLQDVLNQLSNTNYRPSRLHQFLARLPADMHSKGYFPPYPLLVTTCYDRTLEQAFQMARQPFDLVFYRGSDQKFVHVRFDHEHDGDENASTVRGMAQRIIETNEYQEISLNERPVILKLYEGNDADLVLTEDQFLNYLHGTNIERVLPPNLVTELSHDHILFLGCSPNELKIKISLNRVFTGFTRSRKYEKLSWAIQSSSSVLDETIWESKAIQLIKFPLSDYVTELEKRLSDYVTELEKSYMRWSDRSEPELKQTPTLKLTWLHLSDWHQRGGDFDRQVVRNALLDDIRKRANFCLDLEKIDFIIFSGDVAFSGQAAEYEAAKKNLFEPLLTATGLGPERLFIVPGNHDLNRNVLKSLPETILKPFESEVQVVEWLTNDNKRNRLLEPFSAYREFVTQYTGQEHPDYASIRRLEINGKRVALLGLNSALMSNRLNERGMTDDYGHLIVGEPQIHAALREIENDDVRIVVLHHPFDWLAEFDRDRIESLLRENCHFILWSHLHSPSQSEMLQAQWDDCVMISAGASYDRRKSSNGYNFVHLDFETGQGTVYFRRLNDRRNKWIQDIESSGTGRYKFTLPKELLPGQPKRKKEVAHSKEQPQINLLQEPPYRGLMPYSEEYAPLFFGRKREREIIIDNLMVSRLTILYGASGVGKSSILRAGVAYHLRQIAKQNLEERGTPEFAVVVFNSWYNDPIVGLMQQIDAEIKRILPNIQSPDASLSFLESLQAWTEILGGEEGRGQLIIILDQFEEYFLYHPQEEGEGTFAVEFPRAVNKPDLSVNFLISIRDDALAKLDRFRGRIPNILDNRISIQSLDLESAKEAIVKPIKEYNRLQGTSISIEPELVEAVLEQVKDSEGRIEIAYLQLIMIRLWDAEMKAGSQHLRLETLRKLGGTISIIKQPLAEMMNSLSKQEQETAAQIFKYLVTPSGTKIAYPALDLAEYTGLDQPALKSLLDKLSSASFRILRPLPEDRYEIFHDVLAGPILDWTRQFSENQQPPSKLFGKRRRRK